MTTAHLAQTMTLLELTSGELQQKIDNALASNPALELIDEPRCRAAIAFFLGVAHALHAALQIG